MDASLRNLPEVKVKLSLDETSVADFRARLARLTREVMLPVSLHLDMAALAAYRAQIADLTRTQTLTINVRRDDPNPRLTSPGGSGGATSAAGAAASGGTNPYLLATGAAAGLALAPALGALVPMMAGVALGAGTMALAFKGVGGALALAGGDQKKYQEALKKLGPEQRTFTEAIVGLKKEFAPIGREVQKAMLPGFTYAVKQAGPVVKILGKGMTEMGKTFGDAAQGVGKMMKDSGFQKDFATTLKLGNGFVRELTGSMGPFVKSLLDFGAASGPTLKAFSSGISGLLGKGLPGMFKGLQSGISGSSKFLDGIFSALNHVLPALGRFSGAFARTFGPLLGQLMDFSGKATAVLLDGLGGAVKWLGPVFKDLSYGIKDVTSILSIIGPTVKDTASAIFTALVPAFSTFDQAKGPLQRLGNDISANKGRIQEMARVFGASVIGMVSSAVANLPNLIAVFRLTTGGMVTALGGVLHAAAVAFGWIPGIGSKLKGADSAFAKFKSGYISGLSAAEAKTRSFAAGVLPKLQNNKLQMNINSWQSQIETAKAKLKTVPASKQAALRATISDLQAKVAAAKRAIASVTGKSVTITATTFYRQGNQAPHGPLASGYGFGKASGGIVRRASGGVVGFPGGGPVSGPGTETSDSILTRLSNNEYVVKAKSVAKYGLGFLNAVNSGTLNLGRLSSGGLAGAEVASGLANGMKDSSSKVNGAAVVMAAAVEAGVRKELQIASPSKKMVALAKNIGAGLIKGLTGSSAEIKAASASLAKSIWDTFSGSTDNRLAGMLSKQTAKLLDLAAKRDKAAAAIAAGQQMATDQKAAGLSFTSMTALPNGGNTFDAGGILSGLKVRLGQLNAFSANVGKLAKMGLSKDLIGQLISAGPDGGAAYAAALVKATPGTLKALNSTQAQIAKASSSYGNSAADIMYDAGSQAGKGFLTGLKAQQKSIEDSMSSLARAIQSSIKKALKIKSPSRVMAEIGQHVGEGLVMGMDATHAAVVSSSNRMAMATQSGMGSDISARTQQVRDVHLHATTSDKPTKKAVMDVMRDYTALYGPQIAL
ncbi:hypothetical protein OG210_21850 [Streptomyces sp. NBC_00466]|uniref:hypothetical protein n=1 Tax=Streptomyces sp. NBC_00466 TaxID=2903655 RepID=UPI0030E18CF4